MSANLFNDGGGDRAPLIYVILSMLRGRTVSLDLTRFAIHCPKGSEQALADPRHPTPSHRSLGESLPLSVRLTIAEERLHIWNLNLVMCLLFT